MIMAPAFGAEDLGVGKKYGLPVVNPVLPDGTFDMSIRVVGGLFFIGAYVNYRGKQM